MTTDSPLDVVNVYEVPGMVPVALVVGVQRDGRMLIGQHSLDVVRPYEWQYTTSDPARVTLLQQVLEQALVDMRDNQLDHLALQHVTPELVAKAVKEFEDSAGEGDVRIQMHYALEAAGLLGISLDTDAALSAFRRVTPPKDDPDGLTKKMIAALLNVARSKIADGTI